MPTIILMIFGLVQFHSLQRDLLDAFYDPHDLWVSTVTLLIIRSS